MSLMQGIEMVTQTEDGSASEEELNKQREERKLARKRQLEEEEARYKQIEVNLSRNRERRKIRRMEEVLIANAEQSSPDDIKVQETNDMFVNIQNNEEKNELKQKENIEIPIKEQNQVLETKQNISGIENISPRSPLVYSSLPNICPTADKLPLKNNYSVSNHVFKKKTTKEILEELKYRIEEKRKEVTSVKKEVRELEDIYYDLEELKIGYKSINKPFPPQTLNDTIKKLDKTKIKLKEAENDLLSAIMKKKMLKIKMNMITEGKKRLF